MNSIFGYKYDDLAKEYKIVRLQDKEYRNRSFFMGTSYSRPCPRDFDYCPQQGNELLNITGAGESIMRPYYSREGLHLPKDLFDCSNIEEIFEKYRYIRCEEWSVCTNSLEISKNIAESLTKTALQMPGINAKDKIDNFLPFFRNVYHFGSQAMMDSIEKIPQWQPLFSKKVFEAYRLCLTKNYNIKFQIDLMAQMCPIMAILSFESAQDNVDIASLINELQLQPLYKNLFKHLNMKYSSDSTDWSKAQEQKKQHMVIVNKEEKAEIDKTNREYRNNFYNNFLDMLRTMLKYDNGMFEPIGIDLFYYISRQKEKFEGKSLPRSAFFLFNKVASLVDEMMIINQE